jgi:hypothetical protein
MAHRIYTVPETVKVDEESFIDHILKQIVEKDITWLYPGEQHKVTIHKDSAGSHVCSETTAWIISRGIKVFSKQEWVSNTSDLFSKNLEINSIFKNLLSKRAFTLDGVKRVMKQVWSKFLRGLQIRTTKSWEKRLEHMVERKR